MVDLNSNGKIEVIESYDKAVLVVMLRTVLKSFATIKHDYPYNNNLSSHSTKNSAVTSHRSKEFRL